MTPEQLQAAKEIECERATISWYMDITGKLLTPTQYPELAWLVIPPMETLMQRLRERDEKLEQKFNEL